MTQEPLVYILILNYRSKEETLRCVLKASRLNYPNFKILILDNETKEQSELLREPSLRDYEIVCTGSNRGYAGGNNLGISIALKRSADFVWIVNPDVQLEKDSLHVLIKNSREEATIGILGPLVVAETKQIVRTMVDGPGGYSVDKIYQMQGEEPPGVQPYWETDYAEGCAILIRSQIFQEIGLFREEFFLYFEETEFCMRARDSGWKTVICRGAVAFTKSEEEHRLHKEGLLLRNRILLARIREKFVAITVLKLFTSAFNSLVQSRSYSAWLFFRSTLRAIANGVFIKLDPRAPFPGSVLKAFSESEGGKADVPFWSVSPSLEPGELL